MTVLKGLTEKYIPPFLWLHYEQQCENIFTQLLKLMLYHRIHNKYARNLNDKIIFEINGMNLQELNIDQRSDIKSAIMGQTNSLLFVLALIKVK